jgi:RecB family exonuclease
MSKFFVLKMLYNIPYNQDFICTLTKKALSDGENHLIILPGKYLTDRFASEGVNCLSYDDLWFKILQNRTTNITETILIDRIINSKLNANNLVKNAIKKAVGEFFFYGVTLDGLMLFNSQHEILYGIISDIMDEMKSQDISIRANTLNEILNKKDVIGKLFSKKKVYAVLPVIFSPLLYEILRSFQKDFGVNIVMSGFDKSLDYEVTQEHPQFYIRKFLSDEVDVVIDLKENNTKHPDEINKALLDMMCPPDRLHLLHHSQLYDFKHIRRFSSESMSEEFNGIASLIERSDRKKIAIISRKAGKIKMLYRYLKNKIFGKSLRITTSTPTYCSDYEQMKLFSRILDYVSARQDSISEIFQILKHPAAKTHGCHMVLSAEKYLLGFDELNVSDIRGICEILEKNKMVEAAKLVNSVSQFRGIPSGKCFEKKEGDSKLHRILRSHLESFFLIVSENFLKDSATDEMLKILDEVMSCFSKLQNYGFKEYRNIISDLFSRHVISAGEEHVIEGGGLELIEIDLLTPIEARFISYDLVIICDLKEDVWPPEADDHYFISEQTRKRFGYSKPSKYEIGYSASDFISIIASANEVIISELHEKEVFDVMKKNDIESRFLSILYAYNKIGGFPERVEKIEISTSEYPTALEIQETALMNVKLEDRPRAFSSTSLERLMNNPYLYSVEYNLKLKYLQKFFPEKNKLPSHKEFGIVIHNILHKVTNKQYGSFDEYKEIFLQTTNEALHHRYRDGAENRMKLWEAKIHNVMEFLYEYNNNLKEEGHVVTETEKHIAVNAVIGDIVEMKLHASADRIDNVNDKTYICDYKTGQLPTKNEIITGMKPQLSFEGMIMSMMELNKNFDFLKDDWDILPSRKTVLRYIRPTTGEVKDLTFDLEGTVRGISEILRCLYIDIAPYTSTDKYDNYLQAHIMRTISNIEHKS